MHWKFPLGNWTNQLSLQSGSGSFCLHSLNCLFHSALSIGFLFWPFPITTKQLPLLCEEFLCGMAPLCMDELTQGQNNLQRCLSSTTHAMLFVKYFIWVVTKSKKLSSNMRHNGHQIQTAIRIIHGTLRVGEREMAWEHCKCESWADAICFGQPHCALRLLNWPQHLY